MESLRKIGSNTVLLTILVSLMMIEITTALPGEGEIHNKYDRPVIFFCSKTRSKILFWFIMEKLIPKVESLSKNGSKTLLLKILVSLMIIETITALPDEGEV